jgi:hypothetical protein
MARWLKISIKILSVFIGLIILLWLAGTYYINRNKKEVLNSILTQINKNINGKVTAKSMEPTLLSGFPGVGVSLKGILLNDSLVSVHKHNLLEAQDINVNLNLFSLIAGHTKINKIAINDAKVYIYTDSNGYSNTNIFRKKADTVPKKEKKSADLQINRIDFNRVSFIIDNQKRHKLFDFNIKELKGNVDYPDSGWVGSMKLNTVVNSFAFNTQKGSFLKDKELQGLLSFYYSKKTEQIVIKQRELNIGNYPFYIGATINLAEKSSAFAINIKVDKILYKDVALMLSPNISSKLLKFGIDKPVDINGKIIDDGSGKYADPLIKVNLIARKNIVTIPAGQLTDCDFDGSFTNQDTVGGIIGDENSLIRFKNLTAKYYNAPLKVDTLSVTNLSRPVATGYVTSNFPISVLNKSLGGTDFDFKEGSADLKLYCQADIDNFRFTKPKLKGKIVISNADILYLPRKLRLTKSALNLEFDDYNLSIKNSRFQLGHSILNMSCSIDNFLNLYYTAPEKILVNLNMNSPQLNIGEFLPLLGPRNTKKKVIKKSSANNMQEQLSNVLEVSKMDIKLAVNKAIYKKFIAENLNAAISLRGEGIFFNSISVKHAGGSLNLNGNIQPESNYNRFKINSKISRVNVEKFFYAFDNFGIKSVTSKNLRGYLSAIANINGKISSSGEITPRSINGKMIVNLKDAALINFEPLVNVGKFVFRSRNLAELRLNNLDATFNIKDEKIEIEPMQINSSAINLNVNGIYSLGSGTDISMDIPFRNPKGDELLDEQQKKEIRMKGFVLHLKAIDDGKGGVKLKWNRDRDKEKDKKN